MATYPSTPIPHYAWEEVLSFKTVVAGAENGAEQRQKKHATGRRLWTLVYKRQDADTIYDFFNDRAGRFEQFDFDPSVFLPSRYSAGTVDARFYEDSVGRVIQVLDEYDIQVQIYEVK